MFEVKSKYIIGVDECGYGASASDLFVCGLKAPANWSLPGLRDSKKLSPKKREYFSDQLKILSKENNILTYTIKTATPEHIDKIGVYQALHDCFYCAILELGPEEDTTIILDGKRFKEDRYKYEAVIGGDDIIPHISAASILGKVARDAYMVELDKEYPNYNWKKNKGYNTVDHIEAIHKFGYCELHRKTYDPIKSIILKEKNNEHNFK